MFVWAVLETAPFQESVGIPCSPIVLTLISYPLNVIFWHEKKWCLALRDEFLVYRYSLNSRVYMTAAAESARHEEEEEVVTEQCSQSPLPGLEEQVSVYWQMPSVITVPTTALAASSLRVHEAGLLLSH